MEFIRKPPGWRAWLRRLTPEHCVLCGATAVDLPLCSGCHADLPRLKHACPRCAEPMPSAGESLCGRCQQSTPLFDTVYSPYLYVAPVDVLIRRLKFDQRLHLARLLGALLADYLEHALHERPALIVPVPMHRRRLAQRGFNQALELARFVGGKLEIPVAPTLVTRTRPTRPQTDLKPGERERNVRGSFSVGDQFPAGASVLLIDDVMTTSATANAVASVLRRQGAASVTVATVARAMRVP